MMDSPIAPMQMVRARRLVLLLFFSYLAVLLVSPLALVLVVAACWWLAMLPLGRDYRWFMAGAMLGQVAGAVLGVLAASGASLPHETTFERELTIWAGCVAGPLILSQAMVLFSKRTGLPGSEASWRRARVAMFTTAVVLCAWALLAVFLGLLGAPTEGDDPDWRNFASFLLFAVAAVTTLLFMLALFETQRDIHRLLFRPAWRRAAK